MSSLSPAYGEENAPAGDAGGTVHAPAVTIPFSSLASPEAKAAFARVFNPTKAMAVSSDVAKLDITAARKSVEDSVRAYVAIAKSLYPVNITHKTIGGVATEVFRPRDSVSKRNESSVLINLHGGAFLWGAGTEREAESIPIAALGRIKVISVDYRLGPENRFPAASEDVAAVYRELLKDYAPRNIGIYGRSAGGMLAAEAMAWFNKEGLPLPGAIGVLCASLGPFSVGDSRYLAPYLTGVPPDAATEGSFGGPKLYFGDADPTDPLVDPQNSPALLAKFPPTLFITGTRAAELSGATQSHLQLVKAGIDAELYVWDGMWHGFFVDPGLPESKEAYRVIVDFFARHLGKRRCVRCP